MTCCCFFFRADVGSLYPRTGWGDDLLLRAMMLSRLLLLVFLLSSPACESTCITSLLFSRRRVSFCRASGTSTARPRTGLSRDESSSLDSVFVRCNMICTMSLLLDRRWGCCCCCCCCCAFGCVDGGCCLFLNEWGCCFCESFDFHFDSEISLDDEQPIISRPSPSGVTSSATCG